MENMQYAEELVKEFLVFRGFTKTLQALEMELSTDIGKGFQVDKIMDLIFSVYIPNFEANKLVGLLNFFKQCFSSSSDAVFVSTLAKLEESLLRYYIVHAIQSKRKDKVVEFLVINGNDMLVKGGDWIPWLAITYFKNPSMDPRFRIYFSKEWYEALRVSVRNFFSEIFNDTRIPALLKISSEKSTINHLKKDIKQLNMKLSQLQAVLEEKEAHLSRLRGSSNAGSILNAYVGQVSNSMESSATLEENLNKTLEACVSATLSIDDTEAQESSAGGSVKDLSVSATSNAANDSSSISRFNIDDSRTSDALQMIHGGPYSDNGREMLGEEEFPEVKVDFQETFLGHTSPISRCRFSASGNNIASASVDGTVRIWTYDSSTPTSRNATIYCGAEIMSLDWECKSDRLLLVGTADGGIKAWNVDAKRVVCDLNTIEEFPSVLDLKCSPVEPVFVSAAASRRAGSSFLDSLGFASLTVWNMKTWRAMTVLPLGEEPPAITSLCFNHNGKILAAAATDGMIHMFDMSAGLQITGWPAHDSAINSIHFGPDETSIFSLGSDGKVLYGVRFLNGVCKTKAMSYGQGVVAVLELTCSPEYLTAFDTMNSWHITEWLWFCDPKTSKHCRHEMALDADGRRLLVTSNALRAPIYQVRGCMNGLRTLPHSAAITTVDWHPTLPIFLTGSADNSVRVTSIS